MNPYSPLKATAFCTLLIFFLLRTMPGLSQSDLSGVWRGERHMGNVTALWEMSLYQTEENTYTGITVLHWRANNDHNTPYESIHPIQKFFLAHLVGGNTLRLVELDTLEMD